MTTIAYAISPAENALKSGNCTSQPAQDIKISDGITLSMMYADKMMIATFTRLFVMRIVANRRRGVERSCSILEAVFDFSFLSMSSSGGAIEKKATSDPEISAEHNIRTTNKEIAKGNANTNAKTDRNSVKKRKAKSGGSESKIC